MLVERLQEALIQKALERLKEKKEKQKEAERPKRRKTAGCLRQNHKLGATAAAKSGYRPPRATTG